MNNLSLQTNTENLQKILDSVNMLPDSGGSVKTATVSITTNGDAAGLKYDYISPDGFIQVEVSDIEHSTEISVIAPSLLGYEGTMAYAPTVTPVDSSGKSSVINYMYDVGYVLINEDCDILFDLN